MAIVGGLDIHRRQITYDWIDTTTGETRRGQLSPATRLELRSWLAQFDGPQVDFALEATTGWRFVAEELEHAGFRAHLDDRFQGLRDVRRVPMIGVATQRRPRGRPRGR